MVGHKLNKIDFENDYVKVEYRYFLNETSLKHNEYILLIFQNNFTSPASHETFFYLFLLLRENHHVLGYNISHEVSSLTNISALWQWT